MSAAASPANRHLYATMLLSDSYLPGALVLAHSLRDAGTRKKLAALVTLDSVSANAITQLEAVYDYILPVPRIRNQHPANLYLMNRADLQSAFTKINLWKQTQFSKIVYIDADVLAYRAPDELFDSPHAFSAAPDIGWPDIYNTGVMVLTPNMGDYYAMLAMAERGISFDGADQGLINMHFQHSTNRLSFAYNVTPSTHYQYIPAYLHFQSSISMVHFIGANNKPWFSGRSASHNSDLVDEMVGRWWAVHDRHYRVQATSSERLQHLQHNTVHDSTVGASAEAASHRQNENPYANHSAVHNNDEQADNSPIQRTVSTISSPSAQTAVDSQGFECVTFVESHPVERKGPQSPPPMSGWDAQRQPPPLGSKPEAINFPSTHYEMSRDASPFVPPVRYPSPPKNMWYEVPKQPPSSADKPRQIFPWEANQSTPSRSFISPPTRDTYQSAQTSDSSKEAEDLLQDRSNYDATPSSEAPIISLTRETPQEEKSEVVLASAGDPWNSFSRTNAWDEMPEIGRYVQGPLPTAAALQMPKASRVTDFPTEIERPSLPVTPAPIKRPTFWAEESDAFGTGDEAHPLPVAEGVPSQPDWDPAAQLQKLAQQQSEALLRRLRGDDGEARGRLTHDIPSRPLPFGSESLQSPTYMTRAAASAVLSPQPVPGKVPATNLAEGWAAADDSSSSSKHDAQEEGTDAARQKQ